MGMAFFGPALVLLTLFLFLPMLLTFGFSFTDYFALNPELTHFVGLENYINIFKDELFVQSFLNTVKFVVIIVPLQCGGALLLALAINKAAYCKKYFKVAFFVPVVMSLAVSGVNIIRMVILIAIRKYLHRTLVRVYVYIQFFFAFQK